MPPHDDALDFDGLDVKPTKKSAAAAESDFEKELEALFAEELASSDETPASAPPVGAPELEEDALLLDDLVENAPPAPKISAEPELGLDAVEDDEDAILDLGAFGMEGLDITPPEETGGGQDGAIDLGGLDELISGLGDAKAPQPAAVAEPILDAEPILEPEPILDAGEPLDLEPLDLEPLDGIETATSLEEMDIPLGVSAPATVGGEDDGLLELSMDDLVMEEAPAPAASPAAPEADLLDLTLPDLSDPEPGRDLIAEQEQADLGGELNLSLPDESVSEETLPGAGLPDMGEPSAAEMDAVSADAAVAQALDGDMALDGLLEGIEEAEPAPEVSLDPADLLAQIPDAAEPASLDETLGAAAALAEPALAESVLAESGLDAPTFDLPEIAAPASEATPEFDAFAPVQAPAADQASESAAGDSVLADVPATDLAAPLADMALGAAVTGAAVVGVAMAEAEESKPAAKPVVDDAMLAELNERLTQLATQVTGNSVAVVRLEGKLAERERNLAELEERLQASQQEAQALRDELAALRAHMETSLAEQSEEVRQELAQATQAAADKSQAAMDKALNAVDKALAAMDKAQGAADKADSLAPRVESAEMTVRGAGARLAQMENRQAQLDREVFAEISRAVPREAAKVIREEIAHLAESMRDE